MLALHKSRGLAVPGQITLVDRGNALLGQFSDKAHGYALEKLTEAGADVRLGVGVTAVHPDGVQFDDGSAISTRTVVWGGGESGSAVAQASGPSPDRGGRVNVRPDLTVAGYPGVYAVGDVANIPSGDQYGAMFLPQVVTAITTSLLGARLAQRFSSKQVLLFGLAANITAMVLLVVTSGIKSDPAAYPLLLIATAFLGAGFGLTVPVLNTYVCVPAGSRGQGCPCPQRTSRVGHCLGAGLRRRLRRPGLLVGPAPCCPPSCSSCSCLRALGYP